VSAVARVERVEGEVRVDGVAIAGGAELLPDRRISTGPRASALLRFADGTRLELGADSDLTGLVENPKRVGLARGSVLADVARQAPGRPMLLLSPGTETSVLGTRFLATAEGAGFRVDVRTGRVRVLRLSDDAQVEVAAGYFAAVPPAGPLTARPSRSAAGLVALWTFEEGRGTAVRDVARLGPALDLRIPDAKSVRWLPGALEIVEPTILSSIRPAQKVAEACRRTNEVTVEAWVRPAHEAPPGAPEPGRIVTVSSDLYTRNFTLEQGEAGAGPGACYSFRVRTSQTTANAYPPLFRTPVGALAPRLTHVACTRAAPGVEVIYLDGRESARRSLGGTFETWSDALHVHLGDEEGGRRPWAGELHLVAVYSRALPPDEVLQLARAGPEAEPVR
jgi:hypothetical protein